MKIALVDYTEKPLEVMGDSARRCWGSPKERSVGIAKHCFKAQHGRISEFADITFEISECSARLMREVYTHVAGTSRVQESTRYVDMVNFEYITPPKIKENALAKDVYENAMQYVSDSMEELRRLGILKEDYANLLPLGSHSKMVLKINVRSLISMSHQRMCTRAYWEYRDLMKMIQNKLRELGEQWNYIADQLVPKCVHVGYCVENKKECKCFIRPSKEEVLGYK